MKIQSQPHTSVRYGWIIFALVLLFQPNLLIIDPLPDFIACFILASVFARAEDAIPYFSEAKSALLHLGCLGAAKIAGLVLIVLVRSGNTADYDILALVCTVFAIAEIWLSLKAANRVFAALFHLGERTDATALLRFRKTDAEPLRLLTCFFAVFKCVAYAFPQFFALSKINENGSVTVVSDMYPTVLISMMLLSLVVGVIWLVRMISYVQNIRTENKVEDAVRALSAEQPKEVTLGIRRERRYSAIFSFGIFLSFFSVDLIFESAKEINLLPHFIYAFLLIVFAVRVFTAIGLSQKQRAGLLASGGAYALFALIFFVLSCVFYPTYKYPALGISEERFLRNMASGEAGRFYRTMEIFAVLEWAALAVFAVLLGLALRRMIRGGKTDANLPYEAKSLQIKAAVYIASMILAGAAKCVNILLDGNVRLETLIEGDGTTAAVVTSPVPWFGTVAFALTVIYIFISLLFFGSMKEELTGGYHDR